MPTWQQQLPQDPEVEGPAGLQQAHVQLELHQQCQQRHQQQQQQQHARASPEQDDVRQQLQLPPQLQHCQQL
jgi:hypothetical protein